MMCIKKEELMEEEGDNAERFLAAGMF